MKGNKMPIAIAILISLLLLRLLFYRVEIPYGRIGKAIGWTMITVPALVILGFAIDTYFGNKAAAAFLLVIIIVMWVVAAIVLISRSKKD